MQTINWGMLSAIAGWIGMILVVASQIAYFNRWIGRQETSGAETRRVADKAHTRLDDLEISTARLQAAHNAVEVRVSQDIAEIKESLRWIKDELKKKI